MGILNNSFPKNVSKEQCKDTGLVIALVCLFISYHRPGERLILASMLLLLTAMLVPRVFSPAARVWFGLSHLLGNVGNTVILSAIFFAVVTPMGWLRRLLGKDPMQLKKWKQGKESVFTAYEHSFKGKDIENPY